jgi:class 3 adenylate cyclase/tetratricopeptide (TPR) repeat protein
MQYPVSDSVSPPPVPAARAEEADPGAGLAAGQRRYVTVLFADVSGSSEHAERLEAEAYAALLEQFRRFARDIVPRHQGSIARLQGDGLLALFGHLHSHEDDGRRAIEAALDLHAAVATLRAGEGADATRLQLHSGLHAGLVLLIPGDIERGRVDVVGEVPNTAARLCSMAAAGEIMVSAETLGPHAHFFRVDPPRLLPVRGRSAPLNVLRVEGRAEVDRRIDAAAQRGVVPFVGRDAVLAELLAAADAVANGGGQRRVLVSGEPGIGKTRLLDEFRRRLDPARLAYTLGCCESYGAAAPLQPLRQALRTALGWAADAELAANEVTLTTAVSALGDPLAAQAAGIARLLSGRRSDDAATTPELLRPTLVVELLMALARQRPLLLLLDDWQWADDASRQVLDQLHQSALPIAIVLAARSGMGEEEAVLSLPGVLHLRLPPLDGAAAGAAIAAWLPVADPFTAQEIVRRAGGSPLFIEELCHAAAAGGELPAMPPSGGSAWINTLVASRMARLPEPQAQALQVAAVLGPAFERGFLQRLLGTPDAAESVEALLQQDFLVGETAGGAGALRFKHALTREGVYATVEPARRRRLHLRVAEALEAAAHGDAETASPEVLAYHYDTAGISLPAARCAEAAGDQALGVLALDRARAHYITALRALDALPALSRALQLRWCLLAQKLGQACVFDPLDLDQGLRLFRRAAALARAVGDANAIARAEYWLAYVHYGSGRPRAAVQHAELALQHARASDDQRLVAQVQATLGQALASAGRAEAALPLLRAAVDSKRALSRPGSGLAVGSAYSLARTGYTLGDQGQFEAAADCFDQALRMLGEPLHTVGASVRELVAAVHLWQGRWDEARDAAAAGAEIALRCRSHYLVAMGRALSACGAWAAGGEAASLQALRDATHWIEARGGAVSTSLNYGWLVRACLASGQPAEARAHAVQLLQRARLMDRHGLAMGCRELARAAAVRGDARRAARHLALADKAAAARPSPREAAVNHCARARVALLLGQRQQAEAPLDAALRAFEAMQMHWHLAQARALLATM